jgi:hypothetical protein
MRLMLVAGNDDVRTRVRSNWEERGHEVLTCADDHGGPCRGVHAPHDCPLDRPVDLAVLVSTTAEASDLAEMGYVCAQRHRVPTVAIDPMLAADELWHIETETSQAIRRLEAEDAAAVAARLPFPADVAVHRERVRLLVELRVIAPADGPMSAKERLTLADLARDAIRAHDPYVSVIDVNVTDAPDVRAPGDGPERKQP